MIKKLLVISIVLSFNSGCYKTPIPANHPFFAPKKIVTIKNKLGRFKTIVLRGNITAELIYSRNYAIHATGRQEDLDGHKFEVRDQVLYVSIPELVNEVVVKIFVHNLKKLAVTTDVLVNAKNLKTGKLTIFAEDNGTVNFYGKYNIEKIYQHGAGRINISWVDSDNLFVYSNSMGPIYLSGSANSMVAQLSRNALLDAHYLRTHETSIYTKDTARADISVIDKLKATARDKSNIYYYKRPKDMSVLTKESGNVLHLDWMH